MTREQFDDYTAGWTPDDKARFFGFTPTGDADSVTREMKRPDGMIEVVRNQMIDLDPEMVDRIAHLLVGGFFGAMIATSLYGIFHVAF